MYANLNNTRKIIFPLLLYKHSHKLLTISTVVANEKETSANSGEGALSGLSLLVPSREYTQIKYILIYTYYILYHYTLSY